MMIELTDEDRAAIDRIWTENLACDDCNCSEAQYRAGLAAGLERAANEADEWGEGIVAAAIRALGRS